MINQGIYKLVLLLLCLVPVLLKAQVELEVITNPEDVRIQHIGLEDGLTTNNIFDLHVDSYGFLWFTSDHGLGYYDGYGVRNFISQENDTTSLSDDFVHTIYEDSQGVIWASTRRGLSRFNRGRENFRTFYPDPYDLNKPDNNIYFIKEDSKGLFWVFTDAGIFSFDRSHNRFSSYKSDSIYLYNPKPRLLPYWSKVMFAEDTNSNLWIAGVNIRDGLYKYDREEDEFTLYQYADLPAEQASILGTFSVNVDKKGSVWISSWGAGVFRLIDETSARFEQYRHNQNDPLSILSNYLEQIYVDPVGELWISGWSGFSRYNYDNDNFTNYIIPYLRDDQLNEGDTLGYNNLLQISRDIEGTIWLTSWEGYYSFDPGKASINYFSHHHKYPYGAFIEQVYSSIVQKYPNNIVDLITTDGGIIWVSVFSGGIIKIDRQDKKIKHFKRKPDNPDDLIENDISSILMDQKKRLWLGSFKNGIHLLSPETKGMYYNYRADPYNRLNKNKISSNAIQKIYQDRQDNFWICTGFGLNRMIIHGNPGPSKRPEISFVHFLHDADDPESISDDDITDVLEDSREKLWVATDKGLDILDRQTGHFAHILRDPEDFLQNEYSFDCSIVKLFEDQDGYLWIGTSNCGLFRYNVEDSSLVSYQNIPSDSMTISDNNIRQIVEDPWGRLWIGTSKGLNSFDRNQGCFRFFGETEDFHGEMLQGMICDDFGNLWISHNKGVSKLSLARDDAWLEMPNINHFDVSDGLQGYTFNRDAVFKSVDGEIYFGGTNGYNVFHPDSIKVNTNRPEVYITSFHIDQERIYFDQPVYEMETIHLKHKDNIFSLGFIALNFSNPHKNQYAYMLEGFENNWTNCGNTREVRYTNIDPGRYTFLVRGSNNDGLWNETPASINIIIHPPWYRTLLAYITYVILTLLAILAYVRWRTMRLRKDKERLELQVMERTLTIAEQNEKIMEANSGLESQKEELLSQKEELVSQKEELQQTLDQLNETQDQLIQSEKLAALGGLVAGVAHEINTPVGISVTAASSLMDETTQMAELYKQDKISRNEFKEYLNTANQSARLILSNMERTANLVQSFKQVSVDQSTSQKRKFKLKAYTEDVIRSMYSILKKRKITINLDMEDDLELDSYPGTFSQIITNLILNSLTHGFEEHDEGKIELTARFDTGRFHFEYADNGKGISQENLRKIFEPFFTTNKKIGTGLGMHIIYNLVTQKLNGTICCESESNMGTRFIIDMPLAQ